MHRLAFHRPIVRGCTSKVQFFAARTLANPVQPIRLNNQPIKEDYEKANIETFERLSAAYSILGSRSRFSSSANKCHLLYSRVEAIFLEDLMKFPRINNDMISFLLQHYRGSGSIRTLVQNDICELVLVGKTDVAVSLFDELVKYQLIPKKAVLNLKNSIKSHPEAPAHALAHTLVQHAILSGDHLVAASYLIQFHSRGIPIQDEMVRNTLQCLAIDTDLNHSYHAYTILKVLDTYGPSVLTPGLTVQILEYFTKNQKSVYFANEFYTRFQSTIGGESSSEPVARIILVNIYSGQIQTALEIWWAQRGLLQTDHYIEVIKTLIPDINHRNEAEKVIKSLPEEVRSDPDIVDLLLEFYGAHESGKAEFNRLVSQLTPPLRRSTYSSLFRSFLFQNHEEAAEKILSTIFKSKNGITPKDFYYIIDKLLTQGNLDQCISMVKNTNISISKLAYPRIVKALGSRGYEGYEEFLNELSVRFLKLAKDDVALEELTIGIVEYLTKHINVRAAKKTYLRISLVDGKSRVSDADSVTFNFEKYGLPESFKRLLSLSTKGRRRCLEIMAEQAIELEDIDTLRWSIDEMRFLGATVTDIVASLQQYDPEGVLPKVMG